MMGCDITSGDTISRSRDSTDTSAASTKLINTIKISNALLLSPYIGELYCIFFYW